MIYTVTLNPSIDYIVRLDSVEVGRVNRMTSDDKFVGGKGINVSRVLNHLGYKTVATGFLGGFTGKFVEEQLLLEGVGTHFVSVDQDTRINVKIKSKEETEINGVGPIVNDHHVQQLIDILHKLTEDDIVVFAGSAPANLGNQIYDVLIPIARQSGAQIVCDFEGQMLVDALAYSPLLVKPNNHELADIFNVKLQDIKDIEHYAAKLVQQGAQHVIVSLAGDGALLVTQDGSYFAKPIQGQVLNSVGAGDSMVAGFTGEILKSHDLVEALKWGVACGTATAFSEDLATAEFINEIYKMVEVEQI